METCNFQGNAGEIFPLIDHSRASEAKTFLKQRRSNNIEYIICLFLIILNKKPGFGQYKSRRAPGQPTTRQLDLVIARSQVL
jgi:hypothetical protein